MELKEIYSIVSSSKGICTDTRTLKPGEVFLALKGPNHDGNKYALAALKAGAVAAVVDDKSIKGDKVFFVSDTLKTLTDLALMRRKTINVPVIGITGTNGKTTTKELIASVLSMKGRVHCTSGNLNNHIGVPLTILSAPSDAAFLVIEMGANHKGEIALLCQTAMPTHGLITNIGKAHLEGFGSYEEVISAKSELYQWLRENGGIAFFNERSATLKELIYHLTHKAVPYSDPTGTDLVVSLSGDDDLHMNLEAEFEGNHYAFSTSLFGSYNIENVRAAMAVGLFFGITMDKVIEAVSAYKPSNNRSQVKNTRFNTLICDSYNANPSSMMKALEAFSKIPAEKKMVILGDMLELGSESANEHKIITEFLDKLGITEVCLIGPVFKSVVTGKDTKTFSNSGELHDRFIENPPKDYTILIKGSRGMMLEKIYEVL